MININKLIVGVLGASILITPISMFAQQSDFSPSQSISQFDNVYVRTTMGMTMLENKHKEKKTKNESFLTNDNLSGGISIGKRYYNVGAEAGYTAMEKKTYYSTRTSQKTEYANQNFNLDLNSYHYVIDSLEFKTTLGLGMLHTKSTINNKELNSRAEIRGRVGAGFQYNFTKRINANYDVLMQGGNKDFQTHLSNNLSIRYNFM